MRTCAYCGFEAQGNFAIHRDGFGVGPEVELCDDCGGKSTPSTSEIWERIAQPSTHVCAFRRVLSVDEARRGLDMAPLDDAPPVRDSRAEQVIRDTVIRVLDIVHSEEELDGPMPEANRLLAEQMGHEAHARAVVRGTKASIARRITEALLQGEAGKD